MKLKKCDWRTISFIRIVLWIYALEKDLKKRKKHPLITLYSCKMKTYFYLCAKFLINSNILNSKFHLCREIISQTIIMIP